MGNERAREWAEPVRQMLIGGMGTARDGMRRSGMGVGRDGGGGCLGHGTVVVGVGGAQRARRF